MSSNSNTFASQLRHFARSVDIVDDETFDGIRKLIYKYVKNELGAAYFELMREQTIDGDPVLKMFWSSAEIDNNWRVRQADGAYTNPVTLSFGEDEALWVVGEGKQPLTEAEKLEDEWSHHTDLPSYRPMVDQPIRTLVVLPLRRKRPLGVCYFESGDHMGITDVAKAELRMLAESMSILVELYEINRSQSAMTSSAIFELNERLESAKFPKLTRPRFFVAFSNSADPSVKRAILDVLDEFTDKLEFTDWAAMDDAGNINTQIAKEIMRSRFGICYFSEPVEEQRDDGMEYVDNPNVIFEAGMLHARTAINDTSEGGEPAGWIPMRETSSPAAPFDFAAERTLFTPRRADGSVNEDGLREALRNRINKLLGQE